jgi:hypothetical protein
MVENAMRGGLGSAHAVAERGRAAIECLRRATHCSSCKKAKSSHMRGWGASSGMRTFRVLCERCSSQRPAPLSPLAQQQNAAQWRRLEEAERELAAMRPGRR